MARRKESPHEEHADESWLIPYSDLMTLLLALFIVLFASSSVQEEKFNAIMRSFAVEFGSPEGKSLIEMSPNDGLINLNIDMPVPRREETPDRENGDGDGGEGGSIGKNQMNNLYSSLERYVTANSLDGKVGLEFTGEQVVITLKSDIWFQSGSAGITPEMVQQAHTMSALLRDNQDKEHPLEVVVTGHTDNVPIHTSRYPSNWYLSMDRAFNFLAVLLENGELDPGAFSARGYGEYRPIAANDTPEGRQMNRRVELQVTRSQSPE